LKLNISPWVWSLLRLLLLLALMLALVPDGSLVERDADEGSHLMMAWLFHQGFSFYDQIRTDHFRMFDVMLSGWMHLFGFAPQVARAMVATCSAVLLWLLYGLIAVRSGMLAAALSVLLLLVSGTFLANSIVVMQALPWMLFGLASLALLRRYDGAVNHRWLLYASAGVMAVAIQTKMFALLMFPAMALELMDHGSMQGAEWRSRAALLLHWLIAVMAASLLLLAVTAPALFDLVRLDEHLSYLVGSHLGLGQLLPGKTLAHMLWYHLQDFPMLLLAVIGMLLAWRRRVLPDLFPWIWLLTNGVVLALMHPIWHQYYTMISVPVIWLATQAVAESLRPLSLPHPWYRWLRQGVGVILCLLLISLPMRIEAIHGDMHRYDWKLNPALVEALHRLAPTTRWMVTDRAIYPFVAHINVVPELAVTSPTLIYSGVQTREGYLQAIDHYHPELVLLSRFRHLRSFLHAPLMQRGYVRELKTGDGWLYVYHGSR